MEGSAPSPSPDTPGRPPATIALSGSWSLDALLGPPLDAALAEAIASEIARRRWFGAKTRSVAGAELVDAFPLTSDARVALVRIRFADGGADVFQIPLTVVAGQEASRLVAERRALVWALLRIEGEAAPRVLCDAVADEECCAALLALLDSQAPVGASSGEVAAARVEGYGALRGDTMVPLPATVSAAEQSNTSIRFGDRLILKLYRRIETGTNPDRELNAFLSRQGFANIPELAGALEYRRPGEAPWTIALLQRFLPNRGDGWSFVLDELVQWSNRVVQGALAGADTMEVDTVGRDLLNHVARLGERTAEMHLALASDERDPAFRPEPWSTADQQASQERSVAAAKQTFAMLAKRIGGMPDELASLARRVAALEGNALTALRSAAEPIELTRIRIHGDYHLGQVLAVGDDFAIIDFEGEPARPLAERREKQLALRDVAGMVRSFHYASSRVARQASASRSQAEAAAIEDLMRRWHDEACRQFIAAYRRAAGGAAFLPRAAEQFDRLLGVCLLDKAIYELRYELNNRPDWVYLPLAALEGLCGKAPGAGP